jgi:RND family efflux transporter MFP subunit
MRNPFFGAAAVLAGALALSACQGRPKAAATPAPAVTVAHPLVEQVVDWDDYVGQFQAVNTVEVRPRVSGYLVGVHFKDGQMVRRGQELFTIDPRPTEAALQQAEAQQARAEATLANARTELARRKELLGIQAVSKEEYEAQQAAVRTAAADVAAAQANVRAQALNVGFTRITAPISGRVSYRRVDVGNAVVADSTVLTTIVSVDPIRFVFQGSEALFLKHQRQGGAHALGTPVRIRLEDEPDYRWRGKLDFIDNAIEPGTGAIRGHAVVANPSGFLTPGMFGHMQLADAKPYQGMLIPDTAVATQGAKRIVYVAAPDGAVDVRVVELGPLSGGLRVIRSGLKPQDLVIIDGQQRARPGQKVKAKLDRIRHEDVDQGLPTVVLPPAGSATPVGGR